MRIKISDKRKISAIQKEFSEAFPYLRLEFFSKPNQQKKGYDKQSLIPGSKTIGECRKVHNTNSIFIVPAMKVSKLEQIFIDECGLYVQVFRKSGRVWLETTMTDDWTLAEQNKQGEELSKSVQKKEPPFPAEDRSDLE